MEHYLHNLEQVEKPIAQNAYGISEEKILKQVKNEFKIGYDAVVSKRKQKEEDVRDLYVPVVKEDKVNIHSIYTTIQTLMSVYYNDSMIVEFQGRKASAESIANNLNRIAAFDYEEMNLDEIDYQWNWDRFMFGVGIKIFDGWDKVKNVPRVKLMSPLSWIPDPQGGFSIKSHRWAGFQVEATKEELQHGYFNVNLINNRPETDQEEIRRAYQEGRNLHELGVEDTPNKLYSIYHHFTTIEGNKYLVSTANHNTVLIRMIRIEPVFKEEKESTANIMFPIALKYYSPVKGDPFGVSIPDLLRDKQKANSKLFNLTLISATRNALGADKLYNPRKIKNVKDLQKPTIGGKYIAANVNENEPLSNALMTVNKENPTNLPFNIENKLEFQSSLSTGLDSNALGIQSQGNQTATESQITQKNANLRFILGTRIGKWGEADFWKLWRRAYVFNMSGRQQKVIRISKVFGSAFFEFSKKDFASGEDIDVTIISQSEKESLLNKEKADFFALLPQLLASPERTQQSKRYLERKALRLANMSEEDINNISEKTIDEMNAELDVELMNAGEKPTQILPEQDHRTYITIYHQAQDSDIKWQAIEERKRAYMDSLKRKAEEAAEMARIAQGGQGGNTLNNIASSNGTQRMNAMLRGEEQASATPSNADVAGV